MSSDDESSEEEKIEPGTVPILIYDFYFPQFDD